MISLGHLSKEDMGEAIVMKLPQLIRGHFVKRDNRFRATVLVAGRETWAHVPNSGRLAELFTPNRPVWLAPAAAPHRKTAFDLKLVQVGSNLVSVDARLPNPLFAEAIEAGLLPGFDFPLIEREVTWGHSRLDFRLSDLAGVCWVETKSVTLVENGVALFPDVPTGRGRRHLHELIDLRRLGHRAAVVFVIQRLDAPGLAPHEQADPEFAAMLRQAVEAGVEARAFACRVTLDSIAIAGEVPVLL
jgi:sugar fermentation stimulation protein A